MLSEAEVQVQWTLKRKDYMPTTRPPVKGGLIPSANYLRGMKNLLFLFLLAFSFSLSAQETTKGDDFPARAEWRAKWENSMAYTLEALAAIPDSSLSFRPSGGQMSVQEQIQHISGNVYGLSRRFLDYEPKSFNEAKLQELLSAETLGRDELVKLLNDAYAYGIDAVYSFKAKDWDKPVPNFFVGPRSRRTIIYLLQDHATHHRAQVLMYMRLLDLTPPRYRGW